MKLIKSVYIKLLIIFTALFNGLNNVCTSLSRTTIMILATYFIVFSSVSYAALKGEYLFQNNLVSSVPGAPPLMDLGDGAFVAANVNGVTRTVFAFNEGEGLRLDTNGLIPIMSIQ